MLTIRSTSDKRLHTSSCSYSLETEQLDVDDNNKDEIDELPLSDNEVQDGSGSSDEEDDNLDEIVRFLLFALSYI